MDKKEIILVTGPSGVHIKESLQRLNKSITEKNIISIEGKIASKEVTKMPFKEFLGIPPSEQYRFWLKAWRQILEKDIPKKASMEPLFLTFHAVYYHPRKRELFSPINIKSLSQLKKLRKIKMLIVFIDDVYDVYTRLMDEGQMYEYVLKKDKISPLKAIFSSIFNIITLLNWREAEIAFSRLIARFLNIPIFIISTKHPSFMINRLIERPLNELKLYYLSHPITSIRQKSQKYLPSFVGELKSVIQAIISQEDTVLFFPTSIDELIIKREKIDREKYFYWPCLDQRWDHPYPEEELLSDPLPNHLKGILPLNPGEYKVSHNKNNRTTSAISQMLSLLWDFIYKRQIFARDYSLVEQSKNGVIVCRPYLKGIKSEGVFTEIEYNLGLMNKKKKKSKRECFIFSCREDLNKLTIYRFFEEIKRSLKKECLKKIEKDLDDLRNTWLEKHNEVIKKDSDSLRKEVEKEFQNKLDFDFEYGESSEWRGGEMIERLTQRRKIFRQSWEEAQKDPIQTMINEKIKRNELKKSVYYILYNEKKYWENVKKTIKKKLRKKSKRR